MKKILSIIGLVFLYYSPAFSQELKADINNCAYFIDSTEIDIVTLELKNITTEDILIWIEKNSTFGLTTDQKVKSFYFKKKGDFSLIQLVNENLTNEVSPILFRSIIKRLSPGDCFLISIIVKMGTKEVSKSEILKTMKSFLNNNVVYMNQKILSKYFDLKQFETIYYKGKLLCLDGNDLRK